jgi:hypothetical protein
MAKRRWQRNSDADDGQVELANSEDRADTIKAAIRFISDKSAEIKALREELNEYKQKHIKGDLGFKLADWAAVYRISQLEVEDRDVLLDTLREGFKALGIGGTVDWVAAASADA